MSQMLKNVGRGSFYLTLESLTVLVSGLLYSIVVLRWLGPGWFGILSLALSIVGLASVFTGNFEIYLERHAAEFDTRGQYLRLLRAHLWALALKAVLGFLAGWALMQLAPWIEQQYGFEKLGVLVSLFVSLVVFDGFSTTGRATLYGLQQYTWIATLSLLQHVLKLVAVVTLWQTGRGPTALALTISALAILHGALAGGIAFAVAWKRAAAARRDGTDTSPEETPRAILADIFRYCMPLLGARAAFISGQNLSRVVLGKFFPAEALGLFSFAFQTVERFVGLVYAIPSSLLPSLTQLVARGEPERMRRLLDKSFRLVATLACALSFGVFVFAEEITRLLGGERYLPAVGLLRILALVPWVRTAHQPLTMGFYALRKTKTVLVLAVAKFLTEMGSYFLLIPVLGLAGAAWANLAGALVAFAGAHAAMTGLVSGGGFHRRTVMLKTGLLVVCGSLIALLLHAATWDWRITFAVKLAVLVPAFVLGVVLLDLVTRDDLTRAQAIELRIPWMSAVRNRAVALALAADRAIGRLRPQALFTTEGH
jgi:O-antigen/teichoic acid export membrane protein